MLVLQRRGRDPYNPGHEPWTFSHDDPDQQARINDELSDFAPRPERFPGQFLRIYEALAGNGQTPVSLADARRSIELLTSAYWSVKTGEIVQLPLSRDHPFYSGWIEAMKQEFGKTQLLEVISGWYLLTQKFSLSHRSLTKIIGTLLC